jgi:hypothetical protein
MTYQQRVEQEKTELDEKLLKLQAFIDSEAFKAIDPVQTSLLKIQAGAMETYSHVLAERLIWFSRI